LNAASLFFKTKGWLHLLRHLIIEAGALFCSIAGKTRQIPCRLYEVSQLDFFCHLAQSQELKKTPTFMPSVFYSLLIQ